MPFGNENASRTYYVDAVREKKEDDKPRIPANIKEHPQSYNLNIYAPETFSDRAYFKTIHLGGDDVLKELKESQLKELSDWKAKLVVKDPVFKVNTKRYKKTEQLDKFKSMLDGPPKKVGFRLGNSRLRQIAARNIMASKSI